MRVLRPIALQMHAAGAKAETPAGNAVDVGNHGKAGQIERIVPGVLGRRPKNGAITPIELPYPTAMDCVQNELRVLMLENQIIDGEVHVGADGRWLISVEALKWRPK